MNLALDPATKRRIQREIELGHYSEPAEVIAHAVALLEAEENWLLQNKAAINQRLEESMGQAARGETHTPEEARRILADRRANRR
jgi:Arc/MetJ-type ribon-helix-helix transcriptional regulator